MGVLAHIAALPGAVDSPIYGKVYQPACYEEKGRCESAGAM
jgi:hypothetical protein